MPAEAAVSMILEFDGNKVNVGTAIDTTAAYVETKALDFSRVDLVKYLDRIISHVTGRVNQTNLRLLIYGSDSEDGPFTLLDTIDISQNDPGYTDPPGFRFYKFRWEDSFVKERWRLHGFEAWGEFGGDEF